MRTPSCVSGGQEARTRGRRQSLMSRRSYICQDKLKGVLVAAGILLISALHLFSGSRATGKFVKALQTCCNYMELLFCPSAQSLWRHWNSLSALSSRRHSPVWPTQQHYCGYRHRDILANNSTSVTPVQLLWMTPDHLECLQLNWSVLSDLTSLQLLRWPLTFHLHWTFHVMIMEIQKAVIKQCC